MTMYSISLDDVDLGFLPLRAYKHNDFLKKEHFQFQVMKKDNVEEPVPTVFYTCHVCAIEVQAAFAREHGASIKHRANARIASEAMQRTHKLISSLPPLSGTIHPPSGRFCMNCAIVADEGHDKTKDHRVAAMHDNLLWDLMKAYVGEHGDEESKDDYKYNMNSEDQSPENHKKIYSGFGNDGNDATVVSIVNKDPPTSLQEITNNNDRTEEKDRIKTVDHGNRDIFINDDRKNSNATADVVLAQDTSKKQKRKKTKSKPLKDETVVSNCETVSNKNLEKHNKDKDLTEPDTSKTNDTITKRTELNTGNNNILDPSKHQDVIKNIRDPNGLKQVNKTETEEQRSRHDNKNEVTQSPNNYIIPTNSRENQAPAKITDEITNKTYLNVPRNIVVTDETKTWEQVAEYFDRNIFSPYEIELARTCNNKNAEFQVTNNKIYIKVNDDVVIVEKDYFHSYLRLWVNKVRCLVCGLDFDNSSEIFHTNNTDHMRRISNIGDDKNYVRKINIFYSHCMLCNTKLRHTCVGPHNQDRYHLLRKKTNISTISTDKEQQETFKVTSERENRILKSIPVIQKDTTDENETNDNFVHSKIDRRALLNEVRVFPYIKYTIPTGKEQQETFKVTSERENSILKSIPVIHKDTDDEVENETNDNFLDSKIEYPYKAVLGEIWCVICDCIVPRTLKNRIDHTNGSRHAKNMKKSITSELPGSRLDSSPWDF